MQHHYSGDIYSDIGLHWTGPKLGIPPVVHPHHNIAPNNATPHFGELQCPLVSNKQPGRLGETCVHQLLSARLTPMVLSPLGTAACGNAMRRIPSHTE